MEAAPFIQKVARRCPNGGACTVLARSESILSAIIKGGQFKTEEDPVFIVPTKHSILQFGQLGAGSSISHVLSHLSSATGHGFVSGYITKVVSLRSPSPHVCVRVLTTDYGRILVVVVRWKIFAPTSRFHSADSIHSFLMSCRLDDFIHVVGYGLCHRSEFNSFGTNRVEASHQQDQTY